MALFMDDLIDFFTNSSKKAFARTVANLGAGDFSDWTITESDAANVTVSGGTLTVVGNGTWGANGLVAPITSMLTYDFLQVQISMNSVSANKRSIISLQDNATLHGASAGPLGVLDITTAFFRVWGQFPNTIGANITGYTVSTTYTVRMYFIQQESVASESTFGVAVTVQGGTEFVAETFVGVGTNLGTTNPANVRMHIQAETDTLTLTCTNPKVGTITAANVPEVTNCIVETALSGTRTAGFTVDDTVQLSGGLTLTQAVEDATVTITRRKTSDGSSIATLFTSSTVDFVAATEKTWTAMNGAQITFTGGTAQEEFIRVVVSGGTPSVPSATFEYQYDVDAAAAVGGSTTISHSPGWGG